MDTDKSCTANFTIITYTLTTAVSGGGSVSGGGTYNSGTSPTITATPSKYWYFSSWGGSTGCSGTASHTILMNAAKSCTAYFATNWYSGIAGTPLAGQHIYGSDLGTQYQYKTSATAVSTTHGTVGLDPNYPSYMSLKSPQLYPTVDFSTYPAQNACKAIGGRLPNVQELVSIYTYRASYGNNFYIASTNSQYWSATAYDPSLAYYLTFYTGAVQRDSKSAYRDWVRCVTDD